MSGKRWVIGGASGLVGGALCAAIKANGDHVQRLVRPSTSSSKGDTIAWSPAEGSIDKAALEGCDVVVHLGGVGVFSGRWTEEKRKAIHQSRVQSTKLLAETLAGLQNKPSAFVVASATGYYGNRGDDPVTEDAPPGEGFLTDVCVDWEAAADPAREAGIRVAHTRFGIILSPDGGALQLMLPAFKMGVGGKLGDGKQYMSWIALDDVVKGLMFVATNSEAQGPINFTAPEPVRNETFTKTLGSALNRPTFFKVPGFAAKLALGGDMADEMLLGGQRVLPAKLQELGYTFEFPDLQSALNSMV